MGRPHVSNAPSVSFGPYLSISLSMRVETTRTWEIFLSSDLCCDREREREFVLAEVAPRPRTPYDAPHTGKCFSSHYR